MVDRITNAVRKIPTAEVEAAVNSTTRRLLLYVDNDGKHFDHFSRH